MAERGGERGSEGKRGILYTYYKIDYCACVCIDMTARATKKLTLLVDYLPFSRTDTWWAWLL